ncbi:MAG: D-alanine--D-alanine ligase [Prevotella sp.]
MRKIAIICGGDSSEHDVSMRSGAGLYSFFDKERYDVKLVETRGLEWNVHLADGIMAPIDRNDFTYMENGEKKNFDYVYITIHGAPGENGVLQGYFELLGIPYSTCGVLVEALTFDKFALNNYLRAFGVNVADSVLIRKTDKQRLSNADVVARLGLPCFVKPSADGSSYGVSKVKSVDEMDAALELAFSESDEVMIEGFLDGTELSQGCFKTKTQSVVLPATEVVTDNEFFDYDAKYNGQVDEITPARIAADTAERVAAETSRIYDILHCNGIIRVDYIISKDVDGSDKINMLEINTTPGMTATSFIPQQVRAAGLDISKVLSDIVENQF